MTNNELRDFVAAETFDKAISGMVTTPIELVKEAARLSFAIANTFMEVRQDFPNDWNQPPSIGGRSFIGAKNQD
jgi:hypothetical protein